jgi:hypothetical protein
MTEDDIAAYRAEARLSQFHRHLVEREKRENEDRELERLMIETWERLRTNGSIIYKEPWEE